MQEVCDSTDKIEKSTETLDLSSKEMLEIVNKFKIWAKDRPLADDKFQS